MSRHYTDDMDEISGFGGGYEAACRAMVLAGLDWLDAHPDADTQFHGYQGIYGVLMDDNPDAKALTEVMVKATNGDCTGAMHQATVGHVLWIRKHSWEQYVAESRQRAKDEAKENAPVAPQTSAPWDILEQAIKTYGAAEFHCGKVCADPSNAVYGDAQVRRVKAEREVMEALLAVKP